MADAPRAAGSRWLAIAFGVACLLLALHLELGLGTVGSWLGGAGYARRAEALLAAGDARAALAVVEASSLLDEEALDLLGRMPAVSSLANVARREARLRLGITQQLADELVNARSLDAEQRALIDRVTTNAEIGAELDATNARAQLLLGLLYLRRGEALAAPIDFHRAAQRLRRALALDPEAPAAADALALALRRAQS